MIAEATLRAVSAILQREANNLTEEARLDAELWGAEFAACKLVRARVLTDYAVELLANSQLSTLNAQPSAGDTCPCGKCVIGLHP